MQIGECSVVSALVNSERASRDTVNGMQKIPEGGLHPSANWHSCSVCGSTVNGGKLSSDAADASVPLISKPQSRNRHERPVQFSLGTVSCIMVGSVAFGALTAFVLLRK